MKAGWNYMRMALRRAFTLESTNSHLLCKHCERSSYWPSVHFTQHTFYTPKEPAVIITQSNKTMSNEQASHRPLYCLYMSTRLYGYYIMVEYNNKTEISSGLIFHECLLVWVWRKNLVKNKAFVPKQKNNPKTKTSVIWLIFFPLF